MTQAVLTAIAIVALYGIFNAGKIGWHVVRTYYWRERCGKAEVERDHWRRRVDMLERELPAQLREAGL